MHANRLDSCMEKSVTFVTALRHHSHSLTWAKRAHAYATAKRKRAVKVIFAIDPFHVLLIQFSRVLASLRT